MTWFLATLHLLGFGLAVAAVWARARAFRAGADGDPFRRVLAADNAWGVSALVLIGTGLLRAFGGYEKDAAYYLQSHAFQAKMTLLVVILALEAWPMIVLIRARIARAAALPEPQARAFARISEAQAVLLVLMVPCATALARGLWF